MILYILLSEWMIPCIIFVYFNATCILLNSIIPCILFNHYSDPLHICTFYWGCRWSLNLQFAPVIPYIFVCPSDPLHFLFAPVIPYIFGLCPYSDPLHFFVSIITVISYIFYMRQWSLTFFVCDSDPLHFNLPITVIPNIFCLRQWSLYFLFVPVIP